MSGGLTENKKGQINVEYFPFFWLVETRTLVDPIGGIRDVLLPLDPNFKILTQFKRKIRQINTSNIIVGAAVFYSVNFTFKFEITQVGNKPCA